MKKLIYRKSDLTLVGAIQTNTTFEWEIENNAIPNFGGRIEDYSLVETDIEKPKLINNNGVVEIIERPKIDEEILQELIPSQEEIEQAEFEIKTITLLEELEVLA